MEIVFLIVVLATIAVVAGTFEFNKSLIKVKTLAAQFQALTLEAVLTRVLSILIVTLIAYVVLALLVKLENPLLFLGILINSITLVTSMLFIVHYKLYEPFFVRHRKWTGAVGLISTLVAYIFVDSEISNYTHLNAQSLPSARIFVLFAVAPILWSFLIVISMIPMYLLQGLFLIINEFKRKSYIGDVLRSIGVIVGQRLKKKQKNAETMHVLFLGFAISIGSTLAVNTYFANSYWYKHQVARIIVSTSYHVQGHQACKNIRDANIKIHFIDMEQYSGVLKTQSGSYRFFTGKCKRRASQAFSSGQRY